MRKIIKVLVLAILITACSSSVDSNKKMAGDLLDLALSANP